MQLNNMSKHINTTKFDVQGIYVTANFQADTEKEAKQIKEQFQGRAGILGHQKVRVYLKNQSIIQVKEKIFSVLKSRFESIRDESVVRNAKTGMRIFTRVNQQRNRGEGSISIFVESNSQDANRIVNYKLQNLFLNGKTIYRKDLVTRNERKAFDELLQRFESRVILNCDRGNWQVYCDLEGTETSFLNEYS